MNTKKLSVWLKCILATAGLLGLIIYAVVIPVYGNQLRILHPEFSNRCFPWLIFLWLSGLVEKAARLQEQSDLTI